MEMSPKGVVNMLLKEGRIKGIEENLEDHMI